MSLGVEGGIAQYFVDEGFGTLYTDIFVGEEPESPDSLIVVLNTSGGDIPSAVSEEWLVTVRVRDESYETAHSLHRDLAISLQEKGQGFFGAMKIARLEPLAPPVTIGRDIQRRWRVEQIFRALMKRSFTFA